MKAVARASGGYRPGRGLGRRASALMWLLPFLAGVLSAETLLAQPAGALRLYGDGIRAYYQEQRKRAEDALLAAVKQDPEDLDARETVGRVFHEHAARAAQSNDFSQAVQLAEQARQLVRRPEVRDQIERDMMRFAYRRVVQRIARGELQDGRREAEQLFVKARAMITTGDNVFVAIRRLHDIIASLVAPGDIFANDEYEDVRAELQATEWRPDPAVQIQCARWAMLTNQTLLARVFVDRARQGDTERKWDDTLGPLDQALKDRSVAAVVQSNAPDFKVVFDADADVRWRGTFESQGGRRDLTAYLLPGSYRMRCVKPGYEGSTIVLQVPAGASEVTGKCLLASDFLSVTVETPRAGERVRVDGVTDRFMEAPITIKVRPGNYVALVDTGRGEAEDAVLRVPFVVSGSETKVRLNTTYGIMRLICLGGQCDAGDFKVQHYEQGWLGADQPLIRKDKDTYLLPFGVYKITLIKRGYARETHTVSVRPGEMEPEIFTLKAVSKEVEEREARTATASAEAPLPSMFRFRNRLTIDAVDVTSAGHDLKVRTATPAATPGGAATCGTGNTTRNVMRYQTRLQYTHRFSRDGRAIPYLFVEGAYRQQLGDPPSQIENVKGVDTALGAGVYLRQKSDVHVAIGGGWALRYDQWAPDLKHLAAAGLTLRSEVEVRWFRILMRLDGFYGTGRVRMWRDLTTCPPSRLDSVSNASQELTFMFEPAIDLIEAITKDPFVDLLIGLRFGGSLFRERIEFEQGGGTTGILHTYDALALGLTLRFEWRFDLGSALRGIVGAEGLYWLHGPLDPLSFMGSYDKLDPEAATFSSWTARFRVGAEF